jgi:hypothetical protein
MAKWRSILATVALVVGWTMAIAPARAAGPMGVNGGGPRFVDAFKNAITEFYAPSKTESLVKDAAGWPVSGTAQINVWDMRVNMPWNGPDPLAKPVAMDGTYALSFTGKADVSPQDPAMFTVENLKYDAQTNLTTAEIVVPKGQYLNVTKFSNLGPGGIKAVKLIRPGYPPQTKQLFSKDYLNALKPFTVIRFMDFLSTNNYGHPGNNEMYPKVIQWSDRRLPTDATQTDASGARRGIAWEFAIDVANESGKDMWINIPISATPDYVTHLAEMIHKRLDPKLNVYVEYSNEVWNFGFPQNWYNATAAKAEHLGAGERYAKMTVDFGNIFAKEFGETTRTGRVRPVLLWQAVAPDGMRDMCRWINDNYGDPSKFIYGVGGAYYIDTPQTSSVDAALEGLKKSAAEDRGFMLDAAAVAAYFRIKLVAYEGGIGLAGGQDIAVKIATNRDGRVGKIIENSLLNDWFGQSGNLYCYYALYGRYGPFGSWGLLEEDLTNQDTPKYQAILHVIAAPQPHVRAGTLLPEQIGGSISIDESQYLYARQNPNWPVWDNPGSLHEYLIDAIAPGSYEIEVQGRGNSQPNPDQDKEKIMVDNVQQADVPLPAKVTVELKQGLHGLWLIADGKLALGGGSKIVITRKN